MGGIVSRQTKLIMELLARVDDMLLRTDGLLSHDSSSSVEKGTDATPLSGPSAGQIRTS